MALSQIGEILPLILPIDWVWNGLIALSGVLILLRRKLSWLIAIASIFICTAINLYKFFTFPNESFGWVYVAMTFTLSMAAVLVIGYFRYPYLDRRDRWTKVNRRSKVQFPVEVDGQTGAVMATDISLKGARLKFSAKVNYQEGELIQLKIDEHTIRARIIWISSSKMDPGTVGVAFEKPSREFKKWLRASLV